MIIVSRALGPHCKPKFAGYALGITSYCLSNNGALLDVHREYLNTIILLVCFWTLRYAWDIKILFCPLADGW